MYQLVTNKSNVQIIQLQEFFPHFLYRNIRTEDANMSLGMAKIFLNAAATANPYLKGNQTITELLAE